MHDLFAQVCQLEVRGVGACAFASLARSRPVRFVCVLLRRDVLIQTKRSGRFRHYHGTVRSLLGQRDGRRVHLILARRVEGCIVSTELQCG